MPTAKKIKSVPNANPDKKIREEMKEIDGEMRSAATRFRAPQTLEHASVDSEGLGNKFPRRVFADDSEKDSYVEWKRSAPEAIYGQKRLEKEDYEYEKSKAQNYEYAQWLNWAETYFDMRDPAQQRIVEKMMPEYFESREKQIDEVADLQKKIAYLRLHGPRTKEDMFLIYMIYTGKLKVPKGAIWAPDQWYEGENGNDLNRGLFNPHRFSAGAGRPAGSFLGRWNIATEKQTGDQPRWPKNIGVADNQGVRGVAQSVLPGAAFASGR